MMEAVASPATIKVVGIVTAAALDNRHNLRDDIKTRN
jgi:hypothetical protein